VIEWKTMIVRALRVLPCLVLLPVLAGAESRRRDVLLLLPWELSRPSSVAILDGLRRGLAEKMPGATMVIPEHLPHYARDPAWFPAKYEGRSIQLVVAVGEHPYQHALRYRERFWPGVPIVRMINPRVNDVAPAEANTVTLDLSSSPLESAQLAVKLFPRTRRLALVGGSTPVERSVSRRFAEEIRRALPMLELMEWNGLSVPELQDRARQLPADSICLLGMFVEEIEGMPATHVSLSAELVPVLRVPLFDWLSSGLGAGVFGGWVADFGMSGRQAAALAARLFQGESASGMPFQQGEHGAFHFDSRQLTRFAVPVSRLPSGSILHFRTPSLWEMNGPFLAAIYLALLLLFVSVVVLLVERQRRLQSQAKLRERLEFETLMADTSASLTGASTGVEQAIQSALRRLSISLGAVGAVFEGEARRLAWPSPEPSGANVLSIPLALNNRAAGQLSLLGDFQRLSESWSPRLRTFGEMLLNALAREESERQASRSEALSQSMLDSMDGFVVTVDASGNVIYLNRGWENVTAGAGEAMVPRFAAGDHYLSRWEGTPHRGLVEEMRAACRGRRCQFRFEFSPLPKRWLRVQAEPLDRLEGGHVITHHDITERKLAELERAVLTTELAHRNRVSALGELASSLAHEINQPLTAIVANGESARALLAEPQPNLTHLGEAITDVVDDSRRAANVLRQMRTLLKKERPHEFAPVDLSHLARQTVRLVEADALSRRVHLTQHLATDVTVMADAVQLQQVILNLLMNALDAVANLPEAERHVQIRTLVSGRLEVDDAGPGVADEDRERIFQQFFSTKPEGLGIGLAISRTLIQTMGGRIWTERSSLGGARFCVEVNARLNGAGSQSSPPLK
jgi:signal transduction histidine kinase